MCVYQGLIEMYFKSFSFRAIFIVILFLLLLYYMYVLSVVSDMDTLQKLGEEMNQSMASVGSSSSFEVSTAVDQSQIATVKCSLAS